MGTPIVPRETKGSAVQLCRLDVSSCTRPGMDREPEIDIGRDERVRDKIETRLEDGQEPEKFVQGWGFGNQGHGPLRDQNKNLGRKWSMSTVQSKIKCLFKQPNEKLLLWI